MVDEDRFKYSIEIDLGNADASIENLRRALALLNKEFDDPALRNAERSLNRYDKTAAAAAKTSQQFSQGVATARYALLGVSATIGVVGVALTAMSASVYAVGIAWERNFANVIRTSPQYLRQNLELIQTLRENFQDLASVLPLTSEEIAKIGTLGGQLGIPVGQLTAFTGVVARLSAVASDLSADQVATAFGRLNALLTGPDGVNGNFNALASSILKVGTNSVATEGEIANTAVQISSMGQFAGLTAADVVGLAGALASVGVKPELARGVITRVFTNISKAVSEAGERLELFASVSGLSSEQFASTWGTSAFGDTFLKFMRGIAAEGQNAVSTLNELGITSVRDVPALLRLANAANAAGEANGLLAQTFSDARTGFKEATELQEQYSIIAGTMAAKLQLVANNFENFLAVVSGGGSVLGGVVDIINDVLRALTELGRNPVGNFFLQTGVIIGGLVGVLAILSAALIAGYAGVLAMQQALAFMGFEAGVAGVGLTGLAAQLTAVGGAAGFAARALLFVRAALGPLAVAIGALGLGLVISQLVDMARQANGASTTVDAIAKRMAGAADSVKVLSEELGRHGNMFAQWEDIDEFKINRILQDLAEFDPGVDRDFNVGFNFDSDVTNVNENLKKIDQSFADLVSSGNIDQAVARVNEFREIYDLDDKEIRSLLPEYFRQIDLAAEAAGVSTTNYIATQQELADSTTELADTLGVSIDQLEALESALASGSSAFLDFGDIIKSATEEEVFNLTAFNDNLQVQLDALANWQDNLNILLAKGVDLSVVQSLADLGPEGAPLVAAAVEQWGTEGQRAIELFAQSGANSGQAFADNFTTNSSLIIEATRQAGEQAGLDMAAALKTGTAQAVLDVINKWKLDLANNPFAPVTVPVNLRISATAIAGAVAGAVAAATGRRYATGGHISGPGSGTSDQIPAWLSNGEYVIRAASVRKYGAGLFDALNRGNARFASGGMVGGGGSVNFPNSMVTSWGPEERAMVRALGGGGQQNVIVLDDVAIARAANRGNQKLNGVGKN